MSDNINIKFKFKWEFVKFYSLYNCFVYDFWSSHRLSKISSFVKKLLYIHTFFLYRYLQYYVLTFNLNLVSTVNKIEFTRYYFYVQWIWIIEVITLVFLELWLKIVQFCGKITSYRTCSPSLVSFYVHCHTTTTIFKANYLKMHFFKLQNKNKLSIWRPLPNLANDIVQTKYWTH